MRRKEDLPLEKVTVQLFKGDFKQLQELNPALGGARILRHLVRQYIESIVPKPHQLPSVDDLPGATNE